MADLSTILKDPNFVNANPATQQAIFDKWAPQDPNFANANTETQTAIRQKFGIPIAAPDASSTEPIIPQGRKPATLTEQALATPVARAALGLATPLVGAVQFGANVGDYFNEKLGQKPVVSKAISDWWNEVQAMKERGMEATSPEAALGMKPRDVIGTAAGIVPALMQPQNALTKGQQILQGFKQGAVVGTMRPGTDRLSDQAIGGAIGAVLGGAAPVVLPAVAKAAGWIWDAVGGRLVQVKAGKIMREISGDNLAAIQSANAKAAPGLTSAQAVQEAGITAPVYQAAAQRTPTTNIATAKAIKDAADAAAREAMLTSQTPNLAKAEKLRGDTSATNYGAAFAADAQRRAELAAQEQASRAMSSTAGPTFEAKIAPELQALKKNPAIMSAEAEAKKLAATKGIDLGKDPMSTLEGLHYMKLAIDAQFKNPTAATSLQTYSAEALKNTKSQLLGAIEQVSPLYGIARVRHAALSDEVNQAKVLNQLAETLRGSGTAAEKPQQFLNALGQGEAAMLKRAEQNPQFGGVKTLLNEPQTAAVNKVASQLQREADMAALAQQGKEALAGILKERPTTVPGINMASAVANRVASVLRGRVSEKTLETVAKGMQTGKGANELLATLPSAEREAVLIALGQMKISGAEAGLAGGNALTPSRKNQNALVK